jgi:hypothetical protein
MKMSTYCQSCSEPVKTPGVCKSCAVTLRKEEKDTQESVDLGDDGWERYLEDVEREWEISMEPEFPDYPIYDDNYPYRELDLSD